MMVTNFIKSRIPLPTVGVDSTSIFNGFSNERMQTSGRSIRYSLYSYPSYTFTILLSRYNYQCFSFNPSTPQPFFQAAQITLINLNSAAQTIPSRSGHRTPEFMQQCPRSLITTSKHSLQSQCAGTVLLARYPPHGVKPCSQRQMSSLKNRTSSYRRLIATLRTFIKKISYWPCLGFIAPRTTETFWPTKLKKIILTSFFGRKPRLKFHKSFGVIFHTPVYYMWG